MKKFAELEFVQNLGWAKLISVSITIITAYTSAIWGFSTWAAGNKADYVNMRYNELSELEDKIKVLESENIQLRQQLGKDITTISPNSNTGIKEIKTGESDIDPITGLIVSVKSVSSRNNSADIALTLPDGKSIDRSFGTGDVSSFVFNNKNYQIIFTNIQKDSPVKYIIRQTSEK